MSNISVDFDVLNQRGSPAWFTDTFANIPTAGFVGRMFISKDTFAFYRDTGTGWDLIGGPGIGTLTGSGVVGQVSFFNGTQVITGSNNLFWDSTNNRLGINTNTPGQPLDIHSTGNVLVQLNNTTTGNSNISFQNQNVAKWRVGNVYNGAANSFDIFNVTTTSNALSIDNTTNSFMLNGAGIYSGTISLKQNSSIAAGVGYTTLSSLSAGQLVIYFGDANLYAATILNTSLTASRSYTLPNATGTIALTSNLTSYVPYTGATASVDLGIYNLTASSVNSIGYTARGSGTNSGYIIIKQGTTYLGNVVGYNSINANSTKYVLISDADGTNYKSASFQLGSLTNNTERTYTLPDATGTIALTSDLSSYLPLTGGTLTGFIGVGGASATYPITAYRSANGTSAAFGGTAYGIRIDNGGSFSTNRSTIYGVDNSFFGSYQPLSIEASNLVLNQVTGGNVLIGTTTDNGNKLQVTGKISLTQSLVPSLAVNSGYYTIDSAAETFSLGSLGAVNIGSFSGMVLVTNTANGVTMLFLCGGGGATLVSQSIGGAAGTMTNYLGSGYTFTTAYTSTANYSFQLFRTRVIS